jgi:putative hydrolase of the HAD superfamily
MTKIEMIAFDADDTLWHNEYLYREVKRQFARLLAPYMPLEETEQRLEQVDVRNLDTYGYGIKSFILSLVEAGIEFSNQRIQASEIQQIIDFSRQMLDSEIQLIEQVEDTLRKLSASYDLMLITKGDLFEQQRKINRSGLAGYFRVSEVVNEKKPENYRNLMEKYALDPQGFLMVGNSLRSDILPVLAIGGRAVYIPYDMTWDHENAVEPPEESERYFELERISQVPELVRKLENERKT